MIFIHRINAIAQLQQIDPKYGVEIDLRSNGSEIYLNHEAFGAGELFADYLNAFKHAGIILNIKEAGIEDQVLTMVRAAGVPVYFLLDVEFPYMYRATRAGERNIAIRYSEDESIQTVLKYKDKTNWVWVDTNTQLPLDANTIQQLDGFQTCIVCPERWGRPQDITNYIAQMQTLNFKPTAVMTALPYAQQWETYV